MKKFTFLTAMLSFISIYPDKIFFTNSDILTGEIWKETPNNIVLITEHGNYKVNSKKIQSVQFDGSRKYRLVYNDGRNIIISPIKSDLENLEFKAVLDTGSISNTVVSLKWNQILFLRLIKN